ncbi:MAG: formylglycine-generating enzyme family protein [Deltaproteobacteria bacterium]|nr:formylglycine-generating enzyme family protein [Deltaproteobacteria bacterium]
MVAFVSLTWLVIGTPGCGKRTSRNDRASTAQGQGTSGLAARFEQPRSSRAAHSASSKRSNQAGPCATMKARGQGSAPLIRIPAGPFWMGSDTDQRDERPRQRLSLPQFWMQRHEVTWTDYCACVQAHACRPPSHHGPIGPNLPVTGLSFDDAAAYCGHIHMRLPTEREWEKAAAGPRGLRFPWGNKADCKKANYGNFQDQGPCHGKNPGRPAPVESYPQGASPYGIMDMAGNVWEWTTPVVAKGNDKRIDDNDKQETFRADLAVARGGSCCSVFLLPRCANRLPLPRTYRDGDIGFRCAANNPATQSRGTHRPASPQAKHRTTGSQP